MTLKEKFLSIKTYEEYEPIRKEFDGIDIKDPEIKNHFRKLMHVENSGYINGIIYDVIPLNKTV